MHRGVNVAQPFTEVRSLTANGDGLVSEFTGLNKSPNAYSPSELRHAGYDFIRLPVNPAPLLENRPMARARLLDELEKGIKFYASADLSVIIDLHFWSPANKTWVPEAIVPMSNSAGLAAYRGLIGEISARLARYPHGQVALELFNEPPNTNCRSDGWIAEQKILVHDARLVAPVLPLVVSGCGGQLDALVALSSEDINFHDRNLIFSFHFYEPFLFTHQGVYIDYRYIQDVPYPAAAGSVSATLGAMNQTVDASDLPIPERVLAKTLAARRIMQYFSQAPDRRFVAQRLDTVIAWAKRNSVSPNRIVLGEYGAITLRKTDTPEYLKARQTWDEDVQSAAEERGIAPAYWNLPYPKGDVFH
jgi:hypothetical protein